MDAKIRLYVEHPLGDGQTVPLDRGQANYLFNVMRQSVGAHILLFNGQHGEWLAEVSQAGKRGGELTCLEQSKPLQMPPDLWLCFAPIKKARTDFIVEKATEMGAARIVPMQTDFTNSGRFQRDRLQAHAVEAAEQCGGTYVPEVAEIQRFDKIMNGWDSSRRILFCDEALVTDKSAPLIGKEAGQWAIFIGPEGGFSKRERDKLMGVDIATSISLGPRILRADTAAVAAMTLWQQALGDWA